MVMEMRAAAHTISGRSSLMLGGLIALYGNAFAALDWLTGLALGGTLGGVLLGGGSLMVAARTVPDWLSELGLRREGMLRSIAWGALAGLLMGLPGVLHFLAGSLTPVTIDHSPLRQAGPLAVLAILLLKIPLATALCEELAFRGLLQARLRAAYGSRRAILVGSLIFTAWHFVVSFTTLQDTSLAADPLLAGGAYLVQNLAVLVGGLIFAVLRERTGSLAGPVVAHALVDILLVSALYLAR